MFDLIFKGSELELGSNAGAEEVGYRQFMWNRSEITSIFPPNLLGSYSDDPITGSV